MKLSDRCLLTQVQVQVHPQQQQIQESTSQQQPAQQNTEQQIVQVCTFCYTFILCINKQKPNPPFLLDFCTFFLLCLFPGADPGPTARPDAGSGPPSALWLPSTATRCDDCTADSAWGTHWGTAPAGTLMPICMLCILLSARVGI